MSGRILEQLKSLFSLKRLVLIYSVPVVASVCLLSAFGVMEGPDLFFLDQAFRWRGTVTPAPDVAIVAISQQDFDRGAPRWPWPRSLMARLVDQVASHRPAVIAIDILYSERSNTESVITNDQFTRLQPFLYQSLSGVPMKIQSRDGTQLVVPGSLTFDRLASGSESARQQDLEFADAVRRAVDNGVNVVLAAQAISDSGVAGLVEPYQELASASDRTIGLVGIRPDSDGVLRRYVLYGQDKDRTFVYGLALVAVAEAKGLSLPERPSANGDVPLGDGLIVKAEDGQFLVNFRGPAGTYPTLEARDVFRGETHLSHDLKGKIVFIGVTDPGVEDVLPTPYSKAERMAGVEFHAAAADTILSGSYIESTPRHQVILMVVILGLGAIGLGRFARPLLAFGGAAAMLLAVLGAWTGAFVWAGYFLPITALLTAALAGYAFSLADRASVEQVEKQQARAMLSRYLPPRIVGEMLKNPAAARLGGKRAELTVLFSDIRGFTTFSETLAPEEVVALLNHYLTVMTEVIFSYGGTVDKFEGDAILAFFGAPQRYEDDPERAVRTALDMRDRLALLEDKWKEQTRSPLHIGIAINTGQAMVGNIGSQRRMEYTVIGDTVNLTSRLQDLTKEYGLSILISGSTYHRVKHMCRVRAMGPVEVRGRRQPVDIYEVIDLNSTAFEEVGVPRAAVATGEIYAPST